MTDSIPAERHGARATLYGAAVVPFLYPTAERLDALRDGAASEGIRTAAERLGLAAEAEELLDAVAETTVDRLRSAYDDLFGVPGEDGTYPVVPYEAHYTTGGDVGTEQRRIATVAGLLEAFDLDAHGDFDERQDHVATELELMQVLAGRRAAAVHEGEEEAAARLADAEATLLSTHLADFVPPLAHDLRETTGNPVYLAAADLATALVERDNAAHPDPTTGPAEVDDAEVTADD